MAGNASSALRTSWQRRGALGYLLWPVSQLYGALTALRRALYRSGTLQSTRLPVPVITVGNVIAGGAGKTPVTMAIVRHLQARGFRPGVISRGYGRKTEGCRAVTPKSTAHDVGDEPLLLARALQVPVFVASKRAKAGQALLDEHPEVNILVCDDGLQHLALQRDIEVGAEAVRDRCAYRNFADRMGQPRYHQIGCHHRRTCWDRHRRVLHEALHRRLSGCSRKSGKAQRPLVQSASIARQVINDRQGPNPIGVFADKLRQCTLRHQRACQHAVDISLLLPV